MKLSLAILIAAVPLTAAGCGGNQATQMTSFSVAPPPTTQAELSTLPADQMSHVQIYTVRTASLDRTLRLTGAVAYNGFQTTPVITQIGGPVSRIVVTPGEHVRAGQPLLYVTSPDFSQLRTAYLKARDAFQLGDRF
jgi:cobalt-zinc-cadmium efflux system membrane fusion protein